MSYKKPKIWRKKSSFENRVLWILFRNRWWQRIISRLIPEGRFSKQFGENWIGNFHGDFLEVTVRERNKQIGGNIKNPKKHICERNKQIGWLFFHHYSVKLLILFFFFYSLNIWKTGLLKKPSQNVPLEPFLVKKCQDSCQVLLKTDLL